MRVFPKPRRGETSIKGTRHREEQVIAILTQGEAELTTELCRQHGITDQTYYRWRRSAVEWKAETPRN